MYDLVVIGAGPAGYVGALRAAQLGGKVAVVEKGAVGGTCLNRGCIPTKAYARTAEVAELARNAAHFGVRPRVEGLANPDFCVDMAAVQERKRRVISQLSQGITSLFRSWGVDFYAGMAVLRSPSLVEVRPAGPLLEARNVLVATGSRPARLNLPGASDASVLDAEAALELEEIPRRLLIIGAGVIGVELACAFRSFGSEVVLLEKMQGILPQVDEEISKRLGVLMRRKGIAIHTCITITEIGTGPDGSKTVTGVDASGSSFTWEADVIVVAVGRRPDLGGLDLEGCGVELNGGKVVVDDSMMTGVRGIYAAGDVVGRAWLAHVASHEGIVAAEAAMGLTARMDYSVVPACVFSSPEVAWVGLTESQAKAQGFRTIVSRFPFAAVGRAVVMGEADGMVKVVADEDGRILGVHILGPHADDLIHEAAAAMRAGISAEEMGRMIHAHPTLAEALGEAFLGVLDCPVHAARQRR